MSREIQEELFDEPGYLSNDDPALSGELGDLVVSQEFDSIHSYEYVTNRPGATNQTTVGFFERRPKDPSTVRSFFKGSDAAGTDCVLPGGLAEECQRFEFHPCRLHHGERTPRSSLRDQRGAWQSLPASETRRGAETGGIADPGRSAGNEFSRC